jgi:hypothetical protein
MNKNTYDMGKFDSEHKGPKSKEVLAQEIFSLENQAGSIKTKEERDSFRSALQKAKAEWVNSYPNEDYTKFWTKTFKPKVNERTGT